MHSLDITVHDFAVEFRVAQNPQDAPFMQLEGVQTRNEDLHICSWFLHFDIEYHNVLIVRLRLRRRCTVFRQFDIPFVGVRVS